MKPILFLLLLIPAFLPISFADDDATVQEGGVKAHGVIFNIAEDRRIEKIGGLYQPENLDKYVDRRIDELALKIDALQKQLEEVTSRMDKILTKKEPAPAKEGSPAS